MAANASWRAGAPSLVASRAGGGSGGTGGEGSVGKGAVYAVARWESVGRAVVWMRCRTFAMLPLVARCLPRASPRLPACAPSLVVRTESSRLKSRRLATALDAPSEPIRPIARASSRRRRRTVRRARPKPEPWPQVHRNFHRRRASERDRQPWRDWPSRQFTWQRARLLRAVRRSTQRMDGDARPR